MFSINRFKSLNYATCILGQVFGTIRQTRSYASSSIIKPGLIHQKSALTAAEQKLISEYAFDLGVKQRGFFQTASSILNSNNHRGRIYLNFKNTPLALQNILNQHIEELRDLDSTQTWLEPTHLILLYYKIITPPPANGYIPWHQDNGDNDGDAAYPVISFSIGDSCEFLVTDTKPRISSSEPKNSLPNNLVAKCKLDSGDVLSFGGASRSIWHSIQKIFPDTAPEFFPFESGRLNLTFRYTPELIKREDEYKTVRAEDLTKDNKFFRITKMR